MSKLGLNLPCMWLPFAANYQILPLKATFEFVLSDMNV